MNLASLVNCLAVHASSSSPCTILIHGSELALAVSSACPLPFDGCGTNRLLVFSSVQEVRRSYLVGMSEPSSSFFLTADQSNPLIAAPA